MTIRRTVGTILGTLGNLASILYVLEYLGFRLSSLFLPTNAVYLTLAIFGVIVCSAYLLYELGRILRAHNRILTGEIYGEKENKFLVGGNDMFQSAISRQPQERLLHNQDSPAGTEDYS